MLVRPRNLDSKLLPVTLTTSSELDGLPQSWTDEAIGDDDAEPLGSVREDLTSECPDLELESASLKAQQCSSVMRMTRRGRAGG